MQWPRSERRGKDLERENTSGVLYKAQACVQGRRRVSPLKRVEETSGEKGKRCAGGRGGGSAIKKWWGGVSNHGIAPLGNLGSETVHYQKSKKGR